jgi:hypothetical protein
MGRGYLGEKMLLRCRSIGLRLRKAGVTSADVVFDPVSA